MSNISGVRTPSYFGYEYVLHSAPWPLRCVHTARYQDTQSETDTDNISTEPQRESVLVSSVEYEYLHAIICKPFLSISQGSHSDWKPGKWECIFQTGNFQQTGKVRKIIQNTGIFREFQTNAICYFLVIFK